MEEKIKFLKAQGKKKKRQASLIKIEIRSVQYFSMVHGDSFSIIMAGNNGNMAGYITLQLNQTLVVKPGDKIKIEGELIPSVMTVTIEKGR